jgi:hypothetical protein
MQRSLLSLALFVIPLLAVACYDVEPGDPPEGSDVAPPAGADSTTVSAQCAPVETLRCGSRVSGDSSDPDSGHTTVIDGYPVAPGHFDGPEIAWEFVAERSGRIAWDLVDPRPIDVDHDVFVLAGDGPCRADQALARGPNGLDFDVVAGERYYLLIDGYDGDAGPFDVELVCDDDGGGSTSPDAALEETTLVRVATEASPSWVAWREIEVIGVWAAEPDAAPFNLAAAASVQASDETSGEPPWAVIDGSPDTTWNSGDFAPGWIELELPEPALVSEIRLVVAQTPAGSTRHALQLGLGSSPPATVHTFEEDTANAQTLTWRNGVHSSGGPSPDGAPDLSQVSWLHTDVSSWAVTSNLASVSVSGGQICLEYDKADEWPEGEISDVVVVANPWIFIWDNEQWYGATWEWMRPGQTCKNAASVAGDHIKQPPFDAASGWTPTSGETYWFMVSALARMGPQTVAERTQLVPLVWP